jgi:hypothetical protein
MFAFIYIFSSTAATFIFIYITLPAHFSYSRLSLEMAGERRGKGGGKDEKKGGNRGKDRKRMHKVRKGGESN